MHLLVLDALRKDTYLDLHRASARLGVNANKADELRRGGQITHVGGKGLRAMFMLTTFED